MVAFKGIVDQVKTALGEKAKAKKRRSCNVRCPQRFVRDLSAETADATNVFMSHELEQLRTPR